MNNIISIKGDLANDPLIPYYQLILDGVIKKDFTEFLKKLAEAVNMTSGFSDWLNKKYAAKGYPIIHPFNDGVWADITQLRILHNKINNKYE